MLYLSSKDNLKGQYEICFEINVYEDMDEGWNLKRSVIP